MVYPNPFSEQIHISQYSETPTSYSIYDIAGKEIKQGKCDDVISVVNTSDLKTGIYFIRLISGKNSYSEKIVKE
jgi:hypothetical protein